MVKIKSIELGDAEEIYQHLSLLAQHTKSQNDFVLTKDDFIKELNNGWYGLVALEESRIIGSCLYCFANINRAFKESKILFLDSLFVDAKYRNQEIATQLIQELKKIAKNKSISRIQLWCLKSNIEGNYFYKNIGAKDSSMFSIYDIPVE